MRRAPPAVRRRSKRKLAHRSVHLLPPPPVLPPADPAAAPSPPPQCLGPLMMKLARTPKINLAALVNCDQARRAESWGRCCFCCGGSTMQSLAAADPSGALAPPSCPCFYSGSACRRRRGRGLEDEACSAATAAAAARPLAGAGRRGADHGVEDQVRGDKADGGGHQEGDAGLRLGGEEEDGGGTGRAVGLRCARTQQADGEARQL